jgi:iron complex transport system permease protein
VKKPLTVNILILGILAFLLVWLNLFYGSVTLSFNDISAGTNRTIFYDIRLPKTITAFLAGGGLAVAGLLMQTLFRNPLAGPYVLGVSSGASLMVAVVMMVFGGITNYFSGKALISGAAIGGALLVMAFILFISKRSKSNITVLLVGLMFSQILGAIQGIIEYVANPVSLKSFVIWGMGSVSNTTNNDLILFIPIVSIMFISALFLSKSLNALLLGEAYAVNLGINVNKLRILIIVITALLTGIITAFCGPIAFVGLSVPIAARLIFKSSNQFHLLLYCFLLGSITLLLCDSVCQILSGTYMLPINTITTIIGSPIVIYLLFKSKTIS